MKNTLEGINSRKTEAEERISELEDTMEEIIDTEQNKEKRMQGNEASLRDLWDNINAPTFELYGSKKKKRKGKGLRIYLNRLYSKMSLTWGSKESIKFRKCRESHTG